MTVGTEQYHEPPGELSEAARTFARLVASLTEEAEAIGWYQQRLALEKDPEAARVMEYARNEECRHFALDLHLLLARLPEWALACEAVLFKDGDPIENVEKLDADAPPSGGDEAENAASVPPGERASWRI